MMDLLTSNGYLLFNLNIVQPGPTNFSFIQINVLFLLRMVLYINC